jgi:hypothetical protein
MDQGTRWGHFWLKTPEVINLMQAWFEAKCCKDGTTRRRGCGVCGSQGVRYISFTRLDSMVLLTPRSLVSAMSVAPRHRCVRLRGGYSEEKKIDKLTKNLRGKLNKTKISKISCDWTGQTSSMTFKTLILFNGLQYSLWENISTNCCCKNI